ncbi:MAG: hypothetical protein L3J69_03965 [Desulfobacula sp.]|nr:hypothetical protein [Desulfobacula sp.]
MKTGGIVIDLEPRVLSHLQIDVTPRDLARQIKASGSNKPEISKIAQHTLNKVKDIWNPSAIYCWCEFQPGQLNTTGPDIIGSGTIGRIQNASGFTDIDFGHSIQFLTNASHALLSVYTAGQELERASKKASQSGDLLEAFFLDLIGLIVLEKTCSHIKQIAQKKAADSGWGVSPFLSPGSVHGWELEKQAKLCSLLPLEKINVKIQDNAVLSPFQTISCLIGLGPGYDTLEVGATCRVCSKRNECQMKQV